MKGIQLVNLYGPAECTIDVTYYECSNISEMDDIPIGKPVDNTEILIVNKDNKCLPIGAMGEICIMGDLVGKGYVQDSIDNSMNGIGYVNIEGKRAYKTGDIGKIGFDGYIYINGRKDNQIKLRGIKINLDDIRKVILDVEGILDACVVQNNNHIECYYIGNAQVDTIQKTVANKISVYAVPAFYKKVDAFELTESGKIDLKKMKLQNKKNNYKISEYCVSEEENSNILHRLLIEVKKYIEVGPDDNIFDAGIDSLTIIDIASALQEEGYDVKLSDFYENITVRNIVKNLEKKKSYSLLKNNSSDTVVICFPYAGGEPHNFQQIANNLDCDVIGIYISTFDKEKSVEEIANELLNEIDFNKYKNIYVYGQCVGSMIAIEFAKRVGLKINGIILVSPTVRKVINRKTKYMFSPWKYLPNSVVRMILSYAGTKYKYSNETINKFRIDTDRYFRYSPHKLDVNCDVSIILGSRDIFTINRKSMVKKLQTIFSKNVVVYVLPKGKHFLNDSHSNEVCKIIKKCMRTNDRDVV